MIRPHEISDEQLDALIKEIEQQDDTAIVYDLEKIAMEEDML